MHAAPGSSPRLGERLGIAERLLRRYADASGVLPERTMLGAAELCGLTKTERLALAKRFTLVPFEAGRYAAEMAAAHLVMKEDLRRKHLDKRILTAAEEIGLSILLRGGPDNDTREPEEEELSTLDPSDLRRRAMDCLVLHNQKLVHAFLKSYPQEFPALGYFDLAQEGVAGLIRAARGFDPTLGFKFSTYAMQWIRQSVDRAVHNQSRTIRIPVHAIEELVKLRRAERAFDRDGREPADPELAATCGWSVEKLEKIRRADWTVVSTDKPISDDMTLGELLGEHFRCAGADVPVIAKSEAERIRKLIRLFPLREEFIIDRNFGLFDGEERTLEYLGNHFDLSRERIRQIKEKALDELKAAYEHPSRDPHAVLKMIRSDPAAFHAEARKRKEAANDPSRRTHRVPAKATRRPRKRR